MGLYPIKCAACGKTFQWFSGSADQRCERCRTRAASALDAYLSAVKARAAAATPGPWFQSVATIVGADSLHVAELISDQHQDKRISQINADGRFIAHSRTDVDRMRAIIDELRRQRDAYREDHFGNARLTGDEQARIVAVDDAALDRLAAEGGT